MYDRDISPKAQNFNQGQGLQSSWLNSDPEGEIHRGSYMIANVILNLLNELGKRDKMRGLPSILSHFSNEFYKFNNTRARILDSIYHMTLRIP